jgi:Uma2 family endonuclease
MAAYYTRPLGNIIATEAGAMAKVPLTIDHIKTGKYVLNVDALTQQQSVFAPICPDFVIELWSPSDILKDIQFKLDEYVANGATLGFLIYPPQRRVYVYRPGYAPQQLDNPQSVSGDPELQGFTLDLTEIWQ